jgi:hypothetical protein
MTKLFIQIRDGQPYEHPIFESNFREAFPHIDPDNLPLEFANFERIEQPMTGQYEVNEGVTYEWVNGVVKDVWHVRPMTDEEKAAYDNEMAQAKAEALARLHEESNIGTTRV